MNLFAKVALGALVAFTTGAAVVSTFGNSNDSNNKKRPALPPSQGRPQDMSNSYPGSDTVEGMRRVKNTFTTLGSGMDTAINMTQSFFGLINTDPHVSVSRTTFLFN